MDSKEIVYIFKSYPTESKGIIKKVNQTNQALIDAGYDSKVFRTTLPTLGALIKISIHLLKSRAGLHIVRNHPILTPLLAPIIIFKRITGSKFALDIPTPIHSLVKEQVKAKKNTATAYLKLMLIYILSPISNLAFNRIIQYAPESRYFSLFAKRKTLLTANGIDVKSIPFQPKPLTHHNHVHLIAVAHIQYWHGFDRLIKSLHATVESSKDQTSRFKLTIIGDGDAKTELVQLSETLGLEEYITFTGALDQKELSERLMKADIGICSLGLHRSNLFFASTLKAREYIAHGIPIVLAGTDPDFDERLDFVFAATNNEDLIDLDSIYRRYLTVKNSNANWAMNIRKYAETNLDFSVKVRSQFLDLIAER